MEKDFSFEIFAGVVFPLFLLGIFGNALCIASVIYAKVKGNHHFDDDTTWHSKTVFILNLAVVDLLYCLLMVSMCIFAMMLYLKIYKDETFITCKFFVIGMQELAAIDGWSIALIAVTRAFPKIR